MKHVRKLPPFRWMVVTIILLSTALLLKENNISIFVLKAAILILSIFLASQIIINNILKEYNEQITYSSSISDMVLRKKPRLMQQLVRIVVAYLAVNGIYKFDLDFITKYSIIFMGILFIVDTVRNIYYLLTLKHEDIKNIEVTLYLTRNNNDDIIE